MLGFDPKWAPLNPFVNPSFIKQPTFDCCPDWLREIEEYASPKVLKVLVGNKTDRDDREIPAEVGDEFAQRHGMYYLETSAKACDNVDRLFSEIAHDLLQVTNRASEKGSMGLHLPMNNLYFSNPRPKKWQTSTARAATRCPASAATRPPSTRDAAIGCHKILRAPPALVLIHKMYDSACAEFIKSERPRTTQHDPRMNQSQFCTLNIALPCHIAACETDSPNCCIYIILSEACLIREFLLCV